MTVSPQGGGMVYQKSNTPSKPFLSKGILRTSRINVSFYWTLSIPIIDIQVPGLHNEAVAKPEVRRIGDWWRGSRRTAEVTFAGPRGNAAKRCQ